MQRLSNTPLSSDRGYETRAPLEYEAGVPTRLSQRSVFDGKLIYTLTAVSTYMSSDNDHKCVQGFGRRRLWSTPGFHLRFMGRERVRPTRTLACVSADKREDCLWVSVLW